MAAVLGDRTRLATNALFVTRVTDSVVIYANTVGLETTGITANRLKARSGLIARVLADPALIGAMFARAASGHAMADTFANAAGADDVKQAAITDATINGYVAVAWDVIAGVAPTERGQ